MRLKPKLTFCLVAVAGVCVAVFLLHSIRLAQPVKVFRFVPTNSPPFAVPEQYRHLVPTNNWVAEVPFDQNADATVSPNDIEAIKRLGVTRGWWPRRIEKIVIDSRDLAWIEYPTNSGATLRRLTVVKEQGEWRIRGEREWKTRVP